MTTNAFSKRAELDLIGQAFAANGPLTREQLMATVGPMIKPEKAAQMASARRQKAAPLEDMVMSGRRAIILQRIHSCLENGLVTEHEGLYYPHPRFRRDYPELFVEELRSRPDLYELAKWCVGEMTMLDETRNGAAVGVRRCIRQMLKQIGRAVEPGERGQIIARNRNKKGKHNDDPETGGESEAAGAAQGGGEDPSGEES